MRQLRVLMLNHNVKERGTYFRCLAYARHLVRRGHEVDLITISRSRRLGFERGITDGVRVIESPDLAWGSARSGWDPWDTLSRLLTLGRARYDVVHGFDGRPAVRYPARLLQIRGTPYVSDWADWWGRGGVISQRRGVLSRLLFAPVETYFEESCRRLADHLTVISTALVARAEGLGIRPNKITRLPGGAEPDRVRPIDQDEARRLTSIDTSMSVITYAGFVQYDIQFVIEVFASLAETNKQVRLLLIGPPIDDLLLTLPRHARERVLQTGILTGQDTLIHLAASDILLLPFLPKVANIGRWPNKIGEYMCLAKPIVTNPVGDVNEAIGAGAALGAPAEARAYAATIHDLLTDSERRFALGRQARLAAETVFDYANFIPRLEAAYSKAAGEA